MLNNKDYCDYGTTVALEELGFPLEEDYGGVYIKSCGYKRPSLYEAQKWLRNTHNLHISTKPYPCEDGLMWMYEIRRFSQYLVCVVKNKTGFREAEEALLEGIKETAKLLKEEK